MSQQEKQTQLNNTRLTELNQDKHPDFTPKQKQEIIAKGNPKIDNNVIKGYNQYSFAFQKKCMVGRAVVDCDSKELL